ncbi:MAG: SAM-dependent methyltransferase [Elusimicrobia bacterium]|nr:SAM-dependent methyltransferase [Elusimicrobiota bacterium]
MGHWQDMTLRAVAETKRLRCLVTEDAGEARRQFADLRLDCAGKEFLEVPSRPQPAFLRRVLDRLRVEDVGMVSLGGVPCFMDPGGWLVRELRARGVPVRALAGASSLAAVLSLSGYDWIETPRCRAFSFVFFDEHGDQSAFRAAVGRSGEPVVVFIRKHAFALCLRGMRGLVKSRRITAFFDLTKNPREQYPYADRVRTMDRAGWLREADRIRWQEVADVALLIHPDEE